MGFQQSTQRGLAEFALIVAGVLVALGLEGAWANRQDRVNEADYLVDMLQEARANARTVRDVLQVSPTPRGLLSLGHCHSSRRKCLRTAPQPSWKVSYRGPQSRLSLSSDEPSSRIFKELADSL